MGSVTKLEKTIVGAMFVFQLVLLFTVDAVIAVLGPPVLAAVPLGYATLGSEQTVRQLTPKRRRRAYTCIGVLLTAVAASFVFTGDDLSLRLRIGQALFADMAILWLAATVAVSVHARRAVRS